MTRPPSDASGRFEAAEVFTAADLARIADAMARGDEREADRLRARPSGDPLMVAIDAGQASAVTDRGPDDPGPVVLGLECPECGEDAVEQTPDTLVPYPAHAMAVPRYAHTDGEPLCPVMGPRGYEPGQPQEVLADDSDPLRSARSAVSTAVSTPVTEPADGAGWGSGHYCELVDHTVDGSGEAREVQS